MDYQCLLKLASIIIHEAWHYRHGTDEADAYDAQIAYLATRGAPATKLVVSGARTHVLNAQRTIERRRQ